MVSLAFCMVSVLVVACSGKDIPAFNRRFSLLDGPATDVTELDSQPEPTVQDPWPVWSRGGLPFTTSREGREVIPNLDPEVASPVDPEQRIPCDETEGACDDDDLDEFDGDAAAGLAAEPSMLEWAFDQYYAAKTMAMAVASKLETPTYRLVRTEQSYEVREYPPRRWVCTHELTPGFFSSADGKQVFRRLFRYFSGKNGAGARMTVTSPLLLHRDPWYEGAGQWFSACLPLPATFQHEPPHPLSTRVHVQTFPKSRVLALNFTRYADEQEWKEETNELILGARERAEEGVDYNNVYYATYDLPQKFWGRHNEVWLRQLVPEHEEGPPQVKFVTAVRRV